MGNIGPTVLGRSKLRRFWDTVLAAVAPIPQSTRELISEGEALQEELDHLDLEFPGWDTDARLERARRALQIGIPREALVRVYGEELIRAAEAAPALPSSATQR